MSLYEIVGWPDGADMNTTHSFCACDEVYRRRSRVARAALRAGGQTLFGGRERLFFLAEAEPQLGPAGGRLVVEAAARHRGDADVAHQVPRERDVVREPERRRCPS